MAPSSYARSSKRQLTQPHIDAYFSRQPHDPTGTKARAGSSQSITLPDQVQSSLLSVGMRVRKAVPEGYQNKAAEHELAHKSLSLSDAQSHPHAAQTVLHPPPSSSSMSRRAAELAPFCGIHKVGGLDLSGAYDGMELYEDDEGFPGSSQDSMMSNASTSSANLGLQRMSNGRKRGMLDEEEKASDGWNDGMSIPQSAFSGLDALNAASVQRVVAQPRRRKNEALADSNDFGEAAFLHYDENDDMDMA